MDRQVPGAARIVMLVLCTIMLNLFLFLLFLLSFMALLGSTINRAKKQTDDPRLVLLSFLAKRRDFQLLNTHTKIHRHTHTHTAVVDSGLVIDFQKLIQITQS